MLLLLLLDLTVFDRTCDFGRIPGLLLASRQGLITDFHRIAMLIEYSWFQIVLCDMSLRCGATRLRERGTLDSRQRPSVHRPMSSDAVLLLAIIERACDCCQV